MNKKTILFFLFLLFLSFLTFWRLIYHYFEQDEWMGLGHFLVSSNNYILKNGIAESLLMGEGRPVTALVNYIFFTISPFNYSPYAIYSIVIHSAAAFFVYLLLQKIRTDRNFNILLASVFLLNANASQSVTWFSAANSVPLSAILLVVSILLFMMFLKSKKNLSLVFSYITFYLSFLTKEGNILFFLLFLFLLYSEKLSFWKKKSHLNKLLLIFPFFSIFVLSMLRYLIHFFSGEKKGLIVSTSSSGGIEQIIQSAVLYPFEVFSQLFISPFFMYGMAEKVSKLFYENGATVLQIQGEISTFLSISTTVLVLTVFWVLYRRKKISSNIFMFGLIFYLVAVLPYVIITKGSAYLESRYYYLPLIGVVIMLASIKFTSLKSRLIVYGFIAVFLIFQFVQIQEIIDEKIKLSLERKEIVNQIRSIPLQGIKHNLVYVESDTDYIVDGQKLPFQQGIGYMIMVLFHDQNVIPDEFLINNYLWNIGEGGFYTTGDMSFGYFTNKELYEEVINDAHGKELNLIYMKYINSKLDIRMETKSPSRF